ncbi:LOW QUALITY PROTEIN: uncharacterized protein [Amphiura filiformis]|uniref:LOW QUALITY PROTEIN: uncharacterized protein n=1 Tax=Amphiura filiformis TaxID=82378 RepID=UPI003B22142D
MASHSERCPPGYLCTGTKSSLEASPVRSLSPSMVLLSEKGSSDENNPPLNLSAEGGSSLGTPTDGSTMTCLEESPSSTEVFSSAEWWQSPTESSLSKTCTPERPSSLNLFTDGLEWWQSSTERSSPMTLIREERSSSESKGSSTKVLKEVSWIGSSTERLDPMAEPSEDLSLLGSSAQSSPLTTLSGKDLPSLGSSSDKNLSTTSPAEEYSSVGLISEKRPLLALLRKRRSIASLNEINPPKGVHTERRRSLGSPSESGSFFFTKRRTSLASPTAIGPTMASLPEVDPPNASGEINVPASSPTDEHSVVSSLEKNPAHKLSAETHPSEPPHTGIGAPSGGSRKGPRYGKHHQRRWSFSDKSSFMQAGQQGWFWIHERIGKLYPSHQATREPQVQRVSQYDKYINELYNRTPPHHTDADTLKEAASTVRSMVKDREDEVGHAENENKLQQVQDRFPSDDLDLMERVVPREEKFKAAAAARRRSAPTTVLRSALNKVKTNERPGMTTSTSFVDQQSLANMDLPSDRTSPTFSNNNNRQYIMEAPVQCTAGVQSQCRYLFLFNDLLVIAKPNKSASTFRLKHRLRVSELWMATCLEDVCEVAKPADQSFVLGWPTTNCVLTFSSLEERNLWWHCLEKHIDAQRDKEELKTLSVRVINKETKENKATAQQAEQTQLTLQVGLTDTAKKLLDICVEKFSLETDDVNEYQLWVRSSKEAGMYPLIGHEIPYAIKMSHLRDVLAKYDDLLHPDDEDQVLSFAEKELPEHKCQFILRRAGKTNVGISIDTSGVQKRFRKAKKSPFKLSFKRSMSTKPSEGSLSPSGKLFGIPLPILCPDNSLPKPVQDIITVLYNNGPFFTGIFRKSANARVCREVRAKLDVGEDVFIEELPIAAAAALFKEFLRNLPESVFVCTICENWINTNNVEDVLQRIEAIKSLLDRIPPSHVMLLHHVFCMLHYIDLHNDENNMNAHNLSICVAPSMMWPPLSAGAMAQAHATKKVPVLVEFMIVHATEIFGEDVINVFGDPPIRKEGNRRHYSSGDSDSLNSGHDPSGLKRDDSSLESIERELYDQDLSPSPRTLHWPGQVLSPSTLSRDSGLTSSNNELYPESEASSTDSGVESKKETSGSNSSMGSQTGLRHSRSAGYVPEGWTAIVDLVVSLKKEGSEPPEMRYKGKRIVVRAPQTAGMTLQNSPDTSDNEVEISPETLKMLQDLNQESSMKLFSEILHNDKGQASSPRRPQQSAQGHSHNADSRNIESVRPKSVHNNANNSPRGPKWHSPSSSSSSKDYFPHKPCRNSKPVPHEGVRRQLSNSKLQRAMPVTDRPKTLNIRPMQTARGAQPKHVISTPPREFFPRDATQSSLVQNPPPKEGILKSQSDTYIADRRRQQRDVERERIMRKLSPIPDSHRHTPPSYQEAMNRRALLHKSPSVDNAGLKINPGRQQWHRSRQVTRPRGPDGMQSRPSRPPLRSSLSQDDRVFYEDSHRVESGIIYLSSDSESSDDETVDMEHLKLHKSYPANSMHGLKAPTVRRTSSDRTARESRVSNLQHSQDSLKRSSSDRCSPLDSPTRAPIFFAQDTTRKSTGTENNDPKISQRGRTLQGGLQALTERRGINELTSPHKPQIRRSASVEERQSNHMDVGRRDSRNSTTSVDSGNGFSPRTALHFPFPDPHAEPPKSPSSQPKSREVDGKATGCLN